MIYQIEMEQVRICYLEVEANSEEEAENLARIEFSEKITNFELDDEEINVKSIDWDDEEEEEE